MARKSDWRQGLDSGESSGWKTHRGHVQFHMLTRTAVFLIVSVIVAEVFVVDRTPARESDQMWLVQGEDRVGTMSMSVSRQGTLIATTDTAGRVSVRDPALAWRIGKYVDYKGFARTVAFTPDGRALAIGGSGSGIALWAHEQQSDEQVVSVPIDSVSAVAFSPDGGHLAAASAASSQVVIWDRVERRESLSLRCREHILCLAFSPDGRYLAGGGKGIGRRFTSGTSQRVAFGWC